MTELRAIISDIETTLGLSHTEAIEHVCGLLTRSPCTVYSWLSRGKPDIPKNQLELLRFKWQAECDSSTATSD